MEKEKWKSVVYEDGFISQKYLVSNLGNIYIIKKKTAYVRVVQIVVVIKWYILMNLV